MNGFTQIREAVAGDVDDLVALAARRREQYRSYQPQFWRPADDARGEHRRFFGTLIDDTDVAVLVATDSAGVMGGFVVGRTVPPPPVYNPGGLTCLIDDFAVTDQSDWLGVGRSLFEAVTRWGKDRAASQVVVVVAHLDEAQRGMLREVDLSLASEWWVGPLS